MARGAGRQRALRLVVGCVGLPLATALVLLALRDSEDIAGGVGMLALLALLALPALLAGLWVRRWWLLAVPVVGYGALYVIEYLRDPSCAECYDDTRATLVVLYMVLFVLPALTGAAIGVVVGRHLEHRRSRQRAARPTPTSPRR